MNEAGHNNHFEPEKRSDKEKDLARSVPDRVDQLVEQMMQLDQAVRSAFLDRACTDDPGLRTEVLQLVETCEKMGSFLEHPSDDFPDDWPANRFGFPRSAKMPDRIGPYQVLKYLGGGGMGGVFLTERDMGSGPQKIALKIINGDFFNPEALARFASEHRALARMDHPHLARVIEAAQTEQGQPYFAMEYVPGMAITDFCKKHHLPLAQRLDLFQQLCEGVRHAHQRGIIHRDLKPANILAFFQDGRPFVKIIDFGIARAIDGHPLAQNSGFTLPGRILGTPGYMSPEQCDAAGLEVDTRTDVYALGAVLYELITGGCPFTFAPQLSPREMFRIIAEEAPPWPNHRIRSSLAAGNVEPGIQVVAKDLERITMKALDRDRHTRYDSVSTLMGDLEACRKGFPISVKQSDNWYQLGKTIRRHRLVFVSGLLILLSLLVGLGLALVQKRQALISRQQAERELSRNKAVRAFVGRLLSLSDPGIENQNTAAVSLLDRASVQIDADFAADPLVAADLHEEFGISYESLGWYLKAQAQFTQTLAMRKAELGANHPETLSAMERIATILFRQEHYERAVPYYQETCRLMASTLPEGHPYHLRAMRGLANCFRRKGQLQQALTAYDEVLSLAEKTLGSDHSETQLAIQGKAYTLRAMGEKGLAESLTRDLFLRRQQVPGLKHPDTLSILSTLAGLVHDQGRYREAEVLYRQLISLRTELWGEDHLDSLSSRYGLVLALQQQGQYSEAETWCRFVYEKRKEQLGELDPSTMRAHNTLGALLVQLSRFQEAEAMLSQSLDLHRLSCGNNDRRTLKAGNNLVAFYVATQRFEAARQLADRLLAEAEEGQPADKIYLIASKAEALQGLQLYAEAAGLLAEAVGICRKQVSGRKSDLLDLLRLHGECLTRLGQFEQAQTILLEAFQGARAERGRLLTQTLSALIQLQLDWGKPEEAAKWSALAADPVGSGSGQISPPLPAGTNR